MKNYLERIKLKYEQNEWIWCPLEQCVVNYCLNYDSNDWFSYMSISDLYKIWEYFDNYSHEEDYNCDCKISSNKIKEHKYILMKFYQTFKNLVFKKCIYDYWLVYGKLKTHIKYIVEYDNFISLVLVENWLSKFNTVEYVFNGIIKTILF